MKIIYHQHFGTGIKQIGFKSDDAYIYFDINNSEIPFPTVNLSEDDVKELIKFLGG
jgi:hypothetical protein